MPFDCDWDCEEEDEGDEDELGDDEDSFASEAANIDAKLSGCICCVGGGGGGGACFS